MKYVNPSLKRMKFSRKLRIVKHLLEYFLFQVPNEYLLFAVRNTIRRISMDAPNNMDVILPLKDLHNAIAIDFDYDDGKLYFTDVHLDYIRHGVGFFILQIFAIFNNISNSDRNLELDSIFRKLNLFCL